MTWTEGRKKSRVFTEEQLEARRKYNKEFYNKNKEKIALFEKAIAYLEHHKHE